MTKKFKPTNKLEELLIRRQNEEFDLLDFINVFCESDIVVPSRTKINDGNFSPLVFNKENEKMISVFTSVPLVNLYEKEITEYMILTGKNLLGQMPESYGMVVNPGYEVGFDISSKGIEEVVKDFCV